MKRMLLALVMMLAISAPLSAQESMLGEVKMIANSFTPAGWADCNGQLLSIQQHSALYALLGTTYGGDGVTTFAVPDLRGRVPMGHGRMLGSSRTYYPGHKGGSEVAILGAENLPEHTHSAVSNVNVNVSVKIPVNQSESGALEPRNHYLGKSSSSEMYMDAPSTNSYLADPEVSASATSTVDIGVTGNGAPFDIHQPFLAIRYIICLDGYFPRRY